MVGKKVFNVLAVVCILGLMLAMPAFAQEDAHGEATGPVGIGDGIKAAGLGIGAGLAVLGGALGTGRAQGAIGAGGTGAMVEKPELFGRIFILVALPETVVVLGFVLGIMILGS
jgi:V/A-type H+-transporting ATPase subunit K